MGVVRVRFSLIKYKLSSKGKWPCHQFECNDSTFFFRFFVSKTQNNKLVHRVWKFLQCKWCYGHWKYHLWTFHSKKIRLQRSYSQSTRLHFDSIILRIKFRVVVMYQIVLMTMAVSKFISSNGSDKSFVFFSRKPDPHALSEQNAIEQPMSNTDSTFFS